MTLIHLSAWPPQPSVAGCPSVVVHQAVIAAMKAPSGKQGGTVGGFEGDGFAGLKILARATASMSALRSVAVLWDAIALAWMHLMRA